MALAPLKDIPFNFFTHLMDNKELFGVAVSFLDGPDLINLSKSAKSLHKFIKDITNEKPEPKKRMYELKIVFDMKQLLVDISASEFTMVRVTEFILGGHFAVNFSVEGTVLRTKFFKEHGFLQRARIFRDAEFEIFNNYNEDNKQLTLMTFLKIIKVELIDSDTFLDYLLDFMQRYSHYTNFGLPEKKESNRALKVVDEFKENDPPLLNQIFMKAFCQFARNRAWSQLYRKIKIQKEIMTDVKQALNKIPHNHKKRFQEKLSALLEKEDYKPLVTYFNSKDKCKALTKLLFTFGLDIAFALTDDVLIPLRKKYSESRMDVQVETVSCSIS